MLTVECKLKYLGIHYFLDNPLERKSYVQSVTRCRFCFIPRYKKVMDFKQWMLYLKFIMILTVGNLKTECQNSIILSQSFIDPGEFYKKINSELVGFVVLFANVIVTFL